MNIGKSQEIVDETLKHKRAVFFLIEKIIQLLRSRAFNHDESKLHTPEKEAFDVLTPKLRQTTYNSPEYKEFLLQLKPVLDHHYANNRHHPEHFETGINEMDLMDLAELLADWKAATQNTGGNGDLMKSISILSEKYGISPQLTQILINTAKNFGML